MLVVWNKRKTVVSKGENAVRAGAHAEESSDFFRTNILLNTTMIPQDVHIKKTVWLMSVVIEGHLNLKTATADDLSYVVNLSTTGPRANQSWVEAAVEGLNKCAFTSLKVVIENGGGYQYVVDISEAQSKLVKHQDNLVCTHVLTMTPLLHVD